MNRAWTYTVTALGFLAIGYIMQSTACITDALICVAISEIINLKDKP